jgi:hypothetical protein
MARVIKTGIAYNDYLNEYGVPTTPGYKESTKKKKTPYEKLQKHLGPHDIIVWSTGGEWSAPEPYIRSFSSAAEKKAYLDEEKAKKEQERLYWEQKQQEYAARVAQEAAERAEAARRSAQTASARSASRSAGLRRRETFASRSATMTARHVANRLAAIKAAEAAENEETARMNCVGRTCKRVKQYFKGTHNLSGTRKNKQNGGRR